MERGLERGIEEGKVEIAKRLLNLGMEMELIAKSTGLSVREIKALKKC